jgi:hypothetical protein
MAGVWSLESFGPLEDGERVTPLCCRRPHQPETALEGVERLDYGRLERDAEDGAHGDGGPGG